jgi:hypothetical protein
MSRTRFWGTGSAIHTGRSLSHRRLVDGYGRGARGASHGWDGFAGAGKPKGRPACRGSSGVEEKRQREKRVPRRGLGGSSSLDRSDISRYRQRP